jgi:hypothetical protein
MANEPKRNTSMGWLIVTALVVLVFAIVIVGIVSAPAPDTPKQAKAESPGHWMRVAFLEKSESALLDSGYDVHCQLFDDDDRHAIITGHAVNRVFAHHFLKTKGLVKGMKKIGFDQITFWSGNARDIGHDFMEDYDLKR